MKTTPRLLNNRGNAPLPEQLLTDFQAHRLFSAGVLEVLRSPCGEDEILRRQQLFDAFEKSECREKIKDLLSLLTTYRKTLYLPNDAQDVLERWHAEVHIWEEYLQICSALSALSGLCPALDEVARFYGNAEKREFSERLSQNVLEMRELLRTFHQGLLAFWEKNWVTPDNAPCDEFDEFATYAKNLGFSLPAKKKHTARIEPALSQALCALYPDITKQVEEILCQYETVDFREPISYISEFEFFLEIDTLNRKCAEMGIPHCYPKVSQTPLYTVKNLYDVSLLSKNCTNIVPNDGEFTQKDPFFFLTGTNGGGKTSYLRALGLNLILFLSGCPIFAAAANIYPFAYIAAHFPTDERFTQMGRLEEELFRTEEILAQAKEKKAFLFFNETYSSADEQKGFELLLQLCEKIRIAGHFCLYVTHFPGVIQTSFPVLTPQIDEKNNNARTYKIVKTKGSASSYAADILKKYKLDRASLEERQKENGT